MVVYLINFFIYINNYMSSWMEYKRVRKKDIYSLVKRK